MTVSTAPGTSGTPAFDRRALLTGPILGGMIRMYLEKERGGRPDLNTVFSGFGPRFGSLVGAWAIPMLVFTGSLLVPVFAAMIFAFSAPNRGGNTWAFTAGIAAIFLIWAVGAVLMLYFLNRWQYAPALVMDKGYPVTAALRLSWRVVGQNFWQHGLFLIARLLTILAGFIALCVGALVTYPIATAHLIGAELQRRSGLPWIADFRDPMAQPNYPRDPAIWQSFKQKLIPLSKTMISNRNSIKC